MLNMIYWNTKDCLEYIATQVSIEHGLAEYKVIRDGELLPTLVYFTYDPHGVIGHA